MRTRSNSSRNSSATFASLTGTLRQTGCASEEPSRIMPSSGTPNPNPRPMPRPIPGNILFEPNRLLTSVPMGWAASSTCSATCSPTPSLRNRRSLFRSNPADSRSDQSPGAGKKSSGNSGPRGPIGRASSTAAGASASAPARVNRARTVVVVRARWRPILRRAIFVLTFHGRGSSAVTIPSIEAANRSIPNTGSARYTGTDAAIPSRIRARYLRSKCSGTGSLLTTKTTRPKNTLSSNRKANVP